MPVSCRACGRTWPQDPAFVVPCPTCQAPAGSPCRRPSGHPAPLHRDRDQAALDSGALALCPAPRPPVSRHLTRRTSPDLPADPPATALLPF